MMHLSIESIPFIEHSSNEGGANATNTSSKNKIQVLLRLPPLCKLCVRRHCVWRTDHWRNSKQIFSACRTDQVVYYRSVLQEIGIETIKL